ncbi:MAG: ABC transporter ATP-binding protein [Rhodobacteraceae bacterium]|nr:ABC transporter ATP-binding protein [Paracoccaceae bacterium]
MTHTDPPKLELVALRKEYDGGEVVAVENLSLSVQPGETLAILGPSGCGKSTTLNMIVGIETPTSGDILIDGVSVLDQPAGRRSVGLVFQDYAVFTHMTVAQNLAFGLKVRGVAKPEIARAVGETAHMLGLTGQLGLRASRLGGSELQRVAIGRTLVTKPALLLLDEPLSNLETEMRAAMRRELRRLQQEIGLTIIYVTHDQIEALSLAQQIAVMSHGKLRQCAPTDVVYEQPAHTFVAGFIGAPPMNILHGAFETRAGASTFVAGSVRIDAPGGLGPGPSHRRGLMGVRPDAITLATPAEGAATATVRRIEPLGAEAVLTLDMNGQHLAATAPARNCPSEGDHVALMFDHDRVAFFDADSLRNLKELSA